MDLASIRAWLKVRKPQEQSTPQQRPETKDIDAKAPVIRSAFQPARRPRNGQPSTTSMKTSLEIRQRESVVPAKRLAEFDEQSNDNARKLPRLEDRLSTVSSDSEEDDGGQVDSGDAVGQHVSTPSKRSRADSLIDDESPTKKRKTDFFKLSDHGEAIIEDASVAPSIEQNVHNQISIEDTMFTNVRKAKPASRNTLLADDAQISNVQPTYSRKKERLSPLKPRVMLHNQVRGYVKSRTASQKSAPEHQKDNAVVGVDSWTGSSFIPGSRKPYDEDANRIELPKKRARRKRNSATPNGLEVGYESDATSPERSRVKGKAPSAKRQMRMHKPWRLYDDDSADVVE